MMGRHVWMEVETYGDSRKVVKSVFIFIYTPIISISLASKLSTLRIELLARYQYPPSHCCSFRCRIYSYFRKNGDLGIPPLGPGYGTGTFKTTESKIRKNDSCKPRNLEGGTQVVGDVNLMTRSCLDMDLGVGQETGCEQADRGTEQIT